MRHIGYAIIGGLIGLVAGIVFGFVFDSFYTKKSERETKQTMQIVIFGGIGLVGGAVLGFKVANDEEREKQKKAAYLKSLVETACKFCKSSFNYSNFDYATKSYCDECILTIKADYIDKCSQINKIVNGIETLKRINAINIRLDKAESIAMTLNKYESVNLDFIVKKPSLILKSISDYRKQLEV